jgi:hypothetical protein
MGLRCISCYGKIRTMARPRDPRFTYVTDGSGRSRKMETITCGGCGKTVLVRAGQVTCSTSCRTRKQHADGVITFHRGADHPAWKGSDAGYQALHNRVMHERGRADHCERRRQAGCRSITYEWAHLHGTDPGDPQNYISLCKTCHQEYDGQQGSKHANAKLTDDQVVEIRRRYASGGVSQQSLADEFGVDQTAISKITLGRTYR